MTIYKTLYRTKVNRKQKRKKKEEKEGLPLTGDESLKYETNQSHDQCMITDYYRVYKLTLHFRATVALHLNPTLKLLSQFFEAMLNNLHTFQANILMVFYCTK